MDALFQACAHKYVHHYNFVKRDEHAAYGACYTFDNEFNQEYKVSLDASKFDRRRRSDLKRSCLVSRF